MMNRFAITAALALASLALAPIAAQTRSVVPALTTADMNRIIGVQVGQLLTIDLRQVAGSGSGSGSDWRMVPSAGLVQVGLPTVKPVPADGPPVVGGPVHVFQVRVTGPGELALTFVNDRTFGGLVQRAETATFILDAK